VTSRVYKFCLSSMKDLFLYCVIMQFILSCLDIVRVCLVREHCLMLFSVLAEFVPAPISLADRGFGSIF
jgi:hypothetical protein